MKNSFFPCSPFICCVALLALGCAFFLQPTSAAEAGGKIVFSNISGANDAVVKRAFEFASVQSQMESEIRPSSLDQAADLKQQVAQFVPAEKDTAFSVLFVNVEGDKSHAQLDMDKAVVVINLAPLKIDDAEKFGRRVERQVMRGLFFFGGQKPCPNPMCCLWNYESMQHLDMIGRGPCPPCLINGREVLVSKGTVSKFKDEGAPRPRVPSFPAPVAPQPK